MIKEGMSCPYCGAMVEFVDSIKVYGKSYGMLYRCVNYGRSCDAYIGANKVTEEPLGTLANAELRGWRKQVRAKFDPLWTGHPDKYERRYRCYVWLAEKLNMPISRCDIGLFDVEDCKRVLWLFEDEYVVVPEVQEDFDGRPVYA